MKSGVIIYYDRFNGYIELEKVFVDKFTKGGILADEMGLGKTVEVLACILNNSNINSLNESESPLIERPKKIISQISQRNNEYVTENTKEVVLNVPKEFLKKGKSANYIALEKFYNSTLSKMSTVHNNFHMNKQSLIVQCICGGDSETNLAKCVSCGKLQHKACLKYEAYMGPYFCPQCWKEQPLVESEGTLIVTPMALKTQWCQEIRKHIKGNIHVLIYEGYSCSMVYPTDLKKYNIVITTYNVLQHELPLTGSLTVSISLF